MSNDTEELSKVWKKLIFGSKNDMMDLVDFIVSSEKSENLHFDVLATLYLIQSSIEELHVITLKIDAKFEEELTCA